MHRFRRISATPQTLRAQLFPAEDVLEQSDGVGLYDGKDKDEAHGDGRLMLTSHRLFYLDSSDPHRRSCFLDLSWIRQTEYWVGFLKSSPKITLLLGEPSSSSPQSPSTPAASSPRPPTSQEADPTTSFLHPGAATWTCHICGFSNPPRPECGLCGVKRDLAMGAAAEQRRAATANGRESSLGVDGLSLSGPSTSDPTSAGVQEVGEGFKGRKEIACPTCTFLNHPSMFRCEMCDSPLGSSPSPALLRPTPTVASLRPASAPATPRPTGADASTSSTPSHSRAATPGPPSSFPPNAYVRLSFRRGGDKTFYAGLKRALLAKGWEQGKSTVGVGKPGPTTGRGEDATLKVIGIDGIMRTMDWKEQTQQGELEEGLRDLEALMSKAKEMVQTAQTLNAKLTAQHEQQQQTDATDDSPSATLIRSSLVSLGLPLPGPAVTPDMVRSDEAYHRELARELGPLLTGPSTDPRRRPLMRSGPPVPGQEDHRGLIGLDEVWCIWNRARGVSLVSPADFLAACPYLPQFTRPAISLVRFTSGLLALATPYYSTEAFADRVLDALKARPFRGRGIGVIELAKIEGIAIGLAEEMCVATEVDEGRIVRDDQVAGAGGGAGTTRWWEDEMSSFVWQDPNDVRSIAS